jgi:hypothetical protein
VPSVTEHGRAAAPRRIGHTTIWVVNETNAPLHAWRVAAVGCPAP